MSFVSYAQNSEDILLWRALSHVKPGFYIDVGANDPVEHSVTKAFYDAGWNGINIEPLAAFHALFQEQRPRDINLAVAAGAQDGEIMLFDVPAVNGWASSDPGVADAHRAEGYEVTEQRVPLRTLNAICEEHVSGEIHFLKIDVEGFEGEVLRGLDLRRWRPWVLVVEATMPNSRETNHETWEYLVVGSDYDFAYFDGLNRYYVAREHGELLGSLQVQANVFDQAIPAHLANAWRDNAALQGRLQASEQREVDTQHRLAELDARHQAVQAALDAAQHRLAEIDARYQAAQAALEAAHHQRLTSDAMRETVQGERLKTEAALEAAHGDRLATEAALQAAQSQRFTIAAALEAAKSERLVTEQRMVAMKAELQSAQAQLASFAERDLDHDSQLRAALARAQELEAQLHATAQWGNNVHAQWHATAAWGNDLDEQLRAARAACEEMAHALHAMRASTSWRLSKPLRLAGQMYRRATGDVPATPSIRRTDLLGVAKRSARETLRAVAALPPVRKYVVPPLLRIPGVEPRLMRLAMSLRQSAPPLPGVAAATPLPAGAADLSPAARNALSALERARHRSSH